MSGWDAWTDNLFGQGAHHCGIHSRSDGSPWTCKNSGITAKDLKNLETVITRQDQKIFESGVTMEHGVNAANEKWTPLRLEEGTLVLKGKSDTNKEKTMTVCVTKTAVVFGCNKDSSVQANAVRKAVEDTKVNLESSNI